MLIELSEETINIAVSAIEAWRKQKRDIEGDKSSGFNHETLNALEQLKIGEKR